MVDWPGTALGDEVVSILAWYGEVSNPPQVLLVRLTPGQHFFDRYHFVFSSSPRRTPDWSFAFINVESTERRRTAFYLWKPTWSDL
ncbi:MAG: hypothetical protein MK110_03330 [Fuerstiella sp.]|nr:hypothetical protein [Fuerstiella sp.]